MELVTQRRSLLDLLCAWHAVSWLSYQCQSVQTRRDTSWKLLIFSPGRVVAVPSNCTRAQWHVSRRMPLPMRHRDSNCTLLATQRARKVERVGAGIADI